MRNPKDRRKPLQADPNQAFGFAGGFLLTAAIGPGVFFIQPGNVEFPCGWDPHFRMSGTQMLAIACIFPLSQDLAQKVPPFSEQSHIPSHNSESGNQSYAVNLYSASHKTGILRRLRMASHSRAHSVRITSTMRAKSPVTAASRRLLKICL